jgi:hypothetical protein
MKSIIVGLFNLALCAFTGMFACNALGADFCDSHATGSTSIQAGLFIVHRRCGHVLYEIPPAILNRVMLINTEFEAQRERVHDTETSGRFADTRLVRWVRYGDQVHLEFVKFEKRSEVERSPPPAIWRSTTCRTAGGNSSRLIALR